MKPKHTIVNAHNTELAAFARETESPAGMSMEGVDLYSDLEDPFFFGDRSSLSQDQVQIA